MQMLKKKTLRADSAELKGKENREKVIAENKGKAWSKLSAAEKWDIVGEALADLGYIDREEKAE